MAVNQFETSHYTGCPIIADIKVKPYKKSQKKYVILLNKSVKLSKKKVRLSFETKNVS